MPTKRQLRYRSSVLGLVSASLIVVSQLLTPLSGNANSVIPQLAIEVVPATANSGSSFTGQVKITNATNTAGWETDLKYNPYVIQASSTADLAGSDTFLGAGNTRTAGRLGPLLDQTQGILALGGYSYPKTAGTNPAGSNGSATLGTVTFRALLPGTTSIQVQNGQVATHEAVGSDISGGNALSDSITVNGTALYAASAQTGTDFRSQISLFNPTASDMSIGEVFVKSNDQLASRVEPTLPTMQRRSVALSGVDASLASDEFSVMVGSNSANTVGDVSTFWQNYVDVGGTTPTIKGTGGFAAPVKADAYTVQYFPVGFFTDTWDERVVILNPSLTQSASVTILFTRDDGTTFTHSLTVPAGKRRSILLDTLSTINTTTTLYAKAFAMKVTSTVPVVAENYFIWTKRGATGVGSGGMLVRGIPQAQTTNVFSVGYNHYDPGAGSLNPVPACYSPTNNRCNLWMTYSAFYNPDPTQTATITVRYAYQKQPQARQDPNTSGSFTRSFTLGPNRMVNLFTADISNPANPTKLPLQDAIFSAVATSNIPVFAQYSSYYDRYSLSTAFKGSGGYALLPTSGSTKQALSHGFTGGASDWSNYIYLYNNSGSNVTATITHRKDDGTSIVSYTKVVPANGLNSWKVDDVTSGTTRVMDNQSYSTIITAPSNLVASQGIFFNEGAFPTSFPTTSGGYVLNAQAVP
jgi:hypothetical protein